MTDHEIYPSKAETVLHKDALGKPVPAHHIHPARQLGAADQQMQQQEWNWSIHQLFEHRSCLNVEIKIKLANENVLAVLYYSIQFHLCETPNANAVSLAGRMKDPLRDPVPT